MKFIKMQIKIIQCMNKMSQENDQQSRVKWDSASEM